MYDKGLLVKAAVKNTVRKKTTYYKEYLQPLILKQTHTLHQDLINDLILFCCE